MGLAVVHGIAASYGGDVLVDSAVGRGTVVRVLLLVGPTLLEGRQGDLPDDGAGAVPGAGRRLPGGRRAPDLRLGGAGARLPRLRGRRFHLPRRGARFAGSPTSPSDSGGETYWVVVGTTNAALHYDTGKVKGSIAIPMTKAELDNYSIGAAPDPYWSGQQLLLLVSSYVDPEFSSICGWVGTARRWRILAASIGPDGKPSDFNVFAAGESKVSLDGPNYYQEGQGWDCGGIRLPSISLDHDLVAYNIERPTASDPYASEILLRSLVDGSTVRDLTTPGQVYSLQLSGTTMVWMESGAGYATSLPIRISTAANPAAQDLLVYKTPGDKQEWTIPNFILTGNSLAWEGFSTGKVWIRDLTTNKITQVSPSGAVCQLEDFDGTNVAVGCGSDPTALTWSDSFSPDWLVFWAPSVGDLRPVSTPSFDGWVGSYFDNGSLVINTWDDSSQLSTTWTIPVTALTSR